MPRFIIKLHDEKFNKDYYLEWSTIVDAPVTEGCSLEEFTEYYRAEYGRQGLVDLDERIKRVEEKGISAFPPYDNLQSMLECNRAGENETHIDKENIIERYCRKSEQAQKFEAGKDELTF